MNAGTSYGINNQPGISASNIRVSDSRFLFDYSDGTHAISDVAILLPGRHNIENAVAAIAVALQVGIDAELIKKAVASFKGVKRRFEYIVDTEDCIYIDDYAHHPEELRACFNAVRELYPSKKLTVIFQPHLFSRTRDFADGFAEVLGTVDELLLLDIYPAREKPLEGIDSNYLLGKIDLVDKAIYTKEAVLAAIADQRPEVLVTVGAGDIDTLIQPLKKLMSHA